MNIEYRFATEEDVSLLADQRLRFIHASGADLELKSNTLSYFETAIRQGNCQALFAISENEIAGTGIIYYYDSPPSLFNPQGKNGYITSMFVQAEYRRQGIASGILKRLLKAGAEKGYQVYFLSASDMGRPLYEKFGFKDTKNGMVLNLRV